MGYMRHHAILVTSWNAEKIQDAHTKATELGCAVSGIVGEVVNGYQSFFVAPDGSKEGWSDSDLGDQRRSEFIDWMRSKYFSDGSSYLDWAEVQYGDDNDEAIVTQAHDFDCQTVD